MKLIHRFLLVALIAVLPGKCFAQMGNADVRFIPDKCFFVMQFDMQKLYSYEKMGSKSLEKAAKFFKKQSSLDLLDMKTMTLQLSEGENPADFGEDTYGLALTFGKKVDKEKFIAGMSVEYEEGEVDGKKYSKSTQRYAPSIYFPDDKTIVMGVDYALRQMIGKKSGKAKIAGLLRSADPNAEVKGAFHTSEMYMTLLNRIDGEIPFKPFSIEKVFGEAKTAVISGNVKSSTPIVLQVECKTADGAETLAKKGKLLVDLGKATIPISRETFEKQKKEMADRDLNGFEKYQFKQLDMALNGLEVSEKILAATETTSKGKTTYLKVKKMGGVTELMPLIAQMFGGQFEAIDELEQGLDQPLEIEDFE